MIESAQNLVRDFLIDQIDDHAFDIVSFAARELDISQQAVQQHLAKLVAEGLVAEDPFIVDGVVKHLVYILLSLGSFYDNVILEKHTEEHKIWGSLMEPCLKFLRENVLGICYYGFTEILNNAIDHSEGTFVDFGVSWNSKNIKINIRDNGIGIFEKVRKSFDLEDSRDAILELSKGKLTTDPSRHSGEGIFFTSRIFDRFRILANNLDFHHRRDRNDWLADVNWEDCLGTQVEMVISLTSSLKLRDVFDQYTDPESDDYSFSKTHVVMRLAKYGTENLVSRSQAKRVLAGLDRFKEGFLDFTGLDEIGQAFADEIFRVYARNHPEIKLVPINTSEDVMRMIRRAQSALKEEQEKG